MLNADVLHTLSSSAELEIIDSITFAARPAVYAPLPESLHPVLQQRLPEQYPQGLYQHQALAIECGIQDQNVCLATPTASGKTLTFTSITIDRLLTSPGCSAIALYPAKALLHDQLNKWQQALAHTGLRVGVIDGGVPVPERQALLENADILLMTPDVLHAWMMSKLNQPFVQKFLSTLRLVILDEAHCYDGIFGTNMAYLLRRLQAASGVKQFLASSATIGDPQGFLRLLTGLDFTLITHEQDGAAVPEKHLQLGRLSQRRISIFLKTLLAHYQTQGKGRFLVFADSRKRVEELVADAQKTVYPADAGDLEDLEGLFSQQILPYRAGYEEQDRKNIQQALTQGTLSGVVATSAMELGIDIGDIDLVVMLGEPPSVKSFWQRAGRTGRTQQGCILVLDFNGRICEMGLSNYLAREPEPNWLYLDNEYLQYANALCAAEEIQHLPAMLYNKAPLQTLPDDFSALLANELEPKQPIPQELYALKQQALNGPHYAFPVRCSVEKNYRVTCRQIPNVGLGNLNYSQVLREAFPGAIYRYLAKPYRIFNLKHANGEAHCSPIRSGAKTSPLLQTCVFPKFNDRLYALRHNDAAFIAECPVQVSERVIGFTEQFGQHKTEIRYGEGNSYAQKPLIRYIDTTAVCFYAPDEILQREPLAKYMALAFCKLASVQERDIGWGTFISQGSPLGHETVKGFAIYDANYGSLRLTRQILPRLESILDEAVRLALQEGAPLIAETLRQWQALSLGEIQEGVLTHDLFSSQPDADWIDVIAAQQIARCHDGVSHINEEVTVLGYLYTPQGIRYSLKTDDVTVKRQVGAQMLQPIHGVTALEQYNINTGETRKAA